MTYVQRGDLVRTQRYSVTYRAVRQEKLCFAQDGLRVENVYVAKGDSVRAGQLLMELEQETRRDSDRGIERVEDELALARQELS